MPSIEFLARIAQLKEENDALKSKLAKAKAALEFCSVIQMPEKPVKGEEFAQYTLEAHMARSRAALKEINDGEL